jgi:hypothetical protein
MAIAVTVQRVDSTQNQFVIDGTLTFSGSYTANGDVVNFALDQFKTQAKTPIVVEVFEVPVGATGVGAPAASGLRFIYVNGTTLANGRLQIYTPNTTPIAQISGTYAGLTVPLSTVQFRAYIPSFGS